MAAVSVNTTTKFVETKVQELLREKCRRAEYELRAADTLRFQKRKQLERTKPFTVEDYNEYYAVLIIYDKARKKYREANAEYCASFD
jgi:hypothetical protein